MNEFGTSQGPKDPCYRKFIACHYLRHHEYQLGQDPTLQLDRIRIGLPRVQGQL